MHNPLTGLQVLGDGSKDTMHIAKARLVTIVLPAASSERLTQDLKALGVSGYTSMHVNGFGIRGARTYGLTDSGNIRLETIVDSHLYTRIFEHLTAHYSSVAFVAHSHEVDAIPAEHFQPRAPK